MKRKPPGVMRLRQLPDLLPLVAPVLLAAALGAGPAAAQPPAGAGGPAPARPCAWPAWQAFQAHLLQPDGRVLDPSSARGQTVSEAQAYALFFALVADDRAVFERVLRWTEDNLAGGDLALRLPAWQWGRRDDGSWGVLDANSAADADLWLAYALAQAGQRWDERRYRALSSLVAERILREETAVIPGLGRAVLPGAQGFAPVEGVWRLNPSYAPPFLMRWFARHSGDPRWEEVRATALRALREAAPHGFAPDWAYFREPAAGAPGAAGSFVLADLPAADRAGTYDAIRVYLWTGMTAAADPDRAALLQQFSAMSAASAAAGAPPAAVDALSGAAHSEPGPPGFSAAVLPLLASAGAAGALQAQQDRLRAHPPAAGAYYDQALVLFGQGWQEGRYAFAADGSLAPAAPCPTADAPQ